MADKCPKCGMGDVEICSCPIDGPDKGLCCPLCEWTHMDAPWWIEGELRRQLAQTEKDRDAACDAYQAVEAERDRLSALCESLRGERDDARWLFERMLATGARVVTWGRNPKTDEMGYYLDGNWAGPTIDDVLTAAHAARAALDTEGAK